MDSALRNRISKILQVAYRQDWTDRSFSLEKAHVCVELSAIVYEDVQEHELKKASRIHLFASDAYRKLIESGKCNNVIDQLIGAGGGIGGDFPASFFIVRGRYALILGMFFNDVLILAVRGTVFRRLWDWKANVDTKKFYVPNSLFCDFPDRFITLKASSDCFFHRGFFESVVPQFGSIANEIKKLNVKSTPTVVWTGHSLGGAMAATGNALSNNYWSRRSWLSDDLSGSVGAYTFGMPRYCGLGAVCSFPVPHHVYNKRDLVPTVPLRKMGFADCSREYEITDSGMVALSERTDTFDLAGHIPKLLSSIKAHSIDGYANFLSMAVNLPRP